MNERRRPISVRPNGALWSEQTYRDYIGELDRRAPKPVTIERLSKKDPEIAAFEATKRGARSAGSMNDDRYLLPRIPVRGLLLFLGAVGTLIAWTRP